MKSLVSACLLLLMLTACDGGGDGAPVTTASSPAATSATTTVPTPVCEDVIIGAAELVVDIVEVLDQVRYEELVDREAWSEDLVELEERGRALQAEAEIGGCDEGAIRGAVVAVAADMEAESRMARFLLELLAP